MVSSAFWARQRRLKCPAGGYRLAALTIFFFNAFAAASQNFFPAGVFHPGNPKVDSFKAKWYTEQLTALQEPSLFKLRQDSSVQSYRFLWLRTFHHPVAIRVLIQPDGTGTLVMKMADGAAGYKPGSLTLNKAESLTRDRVKSVVEKIQHLNYWVLPARDPKAPGFDGAQWIVEGIAHGQYRLVDRWTPESGPVRELGLYFLRDLAHLHLKADEIY